MEADTPGNKQRQPDLQEFLTQFQQFGEDKKKYILEKLQSAVTPESRGNSDCKKVLEEKFKSSEQHTSTEEVTTTTRSSQVEQDSLLTFEKRSGCISQGDDFEIFMCSLYALKLSINNEILGFKMTSNEDKCGAFDDIKLDVTFTNGTRRIFLLQLKHKSDNKKCIRNQHLFSDQGDFSLPKYFKSQKEIVENDAVCIIYTNCLINIQQENSLNGISIEKCNMEYEDIIANSQESDSDAIFQCKSSKTNQIIYLLGRQKNLHKTQNYIKETLRELLQCDIYSSFFNFMKEWWSGRFVLNKSDFIAKLTELALSPFLKTVSGSKQNEKTICLKKAIMDFQITIVKNDDNIVESIWPNEEIAAKKIYEKTAQKFGLDSKSRILWYMSKVPLMVKVDDSNKEIVKSVLKIFQKSCGTKKLVLIESFTKSELGGWHIFENLCDLSQINNEDINFNVSLQGRNAISVETLLEIDKIFAEIVEVEHLLKMTQEDLIIGDQLQQPLDYYIPRDITVRYTNTKEILGYGKKSMKDTFIIVNCDKKFQDYWKLTFDILEVGDYLKSEVVREEENFILVSTNKNCTIGNFEDVFAKSKKPNLYLFQANNENYRECILLMSKGNRLQIKESEELVNEKFIHHHFSNSFNVFCAPPGMGKSTLMQVLYNNTPSENWAIYINLIKQNSFLSKNPTNEVILSHFLQLKEDFISKFKERLVINNKIYIYLDGLDEIDSKNVNKIISFIKYASSKEIKIWVSSRENLRGKLIQDLSVVPIQIRELDEDQQKNYVIKRLRNTFSFDKIEKVMKAMFKSLDINHSRELLGIPLQLHIITEMFLTNEDAYKNLEQRNFFVLTQMYRLYFEGKKKSELKKLGLDEIEYRLGINYENILEQYEIPALRTCLDEEDYTKLEVDEQQNFLRRIEKEGDVYGIIKTVDNCETVFVHQTYAEFFACSWLGKNLNKVKVLQDGFFSERYENLRLMFDVMLAQNNPLHLAIIYENMDQFEKNIQDFKVADSGGRLPLRLACMYGAKYSKQPIICTISSSSNFKLYYSNLKRESDFYVNAIEILLKQDTSLNQRDDLFDLDYVQYSLRSKCLYPIEKMLEADKINFQEYQNTIFEFYTPKVLIGYAAQFGYSNLFVNLIKFRSDEMELTTARLLKFAILGVVDDVYRIPRLGNITVVKTLLEEYQEKSEGNILEFACLNGCYDVLETLTQNGEKCLDGNTILHLTAPYSGFSKTVIKLLQNENTKKMIRDVVNVPNKFGQTALHLVCEKNEDEIAQQLIAYGADVNIADYDDNNTLHYASKADYVQNQNLLSVLIEAGVKINAKNKDGQTTLHLACEKNKDELAQKLIENGANVDIVDKSNESALHSVLKANEPNLRLLDALIGAGADVNARNKDGQTVLHLACEKNKEEVVEKLIESGADINILDNNNNNVLHFASRTNKENPKLISILIDVGVDVNAQNIDGHSALHLACRKNNYEIAKKLLESGVDVNIIDKNNNTPFYYASRQRRLNQKLLFMLIDAGLDVNAQNSNGQTALHMGCAIGDVEIVKKLIESGADVNILDKRNNSVVYYASRVHRPSQELLLNVLLDAGLDVNSGREIAKKLIENETTLSC